MYAPAYADDLLAKKILGDVTKIYLSSMVYIFKNQPLINQKGGDKSDLFGEKFISNIKTTYQAKYNEPFPLEDHITKKMLIQAMIEVMDDNRELFNDPELGFKGIIPAIFAFQLGAKLSTKGIGLKIKFTRTKDSIRNKSNMPDAWEASVMQRIIQKPEIYYDENALLNGKAAYRQFTPLPMAPYCLHCHGRPADNPLNYDKEPSQWTTIDITGFEMENWEIDDFGGGVSISIEKSIIR